MWEKLAITVLGLTLVGLTGCDERTSRLQPRLQPTTDAAAPARTNPPETQPATRARPPGAGGSHAGVPGPDAS